MVVWYAVFGLLGGMLGGMGMGGGTLTIPLLTLFGGIAQQSAQAYNLISFIPTAVVALVLHSKQKLVKWKDLLYIIIPATIFAVIGSLFALQVDAKLLKVIFGIFLIVLAVIFFILGVVVKKKN